MRLVPILVRDRLPLRKDGAMFWGYCYGPVIAILRGHEDDPALIRHEREHVKQFYMTLGLHLILYPLCRRYRLWAERKAHAAEGVPLNEEWY